jgi:hypothetical protein
MAEEIGLMLILSSDVNTGVAGVVKMEDSLEHIGESSEKAAGAASGALESIVPSVNVVSGAVGALPRAFDAVGDAASSAMGQSAGAALKAAKGVGVYVDAVRDAANSGQILKEQARAGQLAFINQSGAAVNAGKSISGGVVPALSKLTKSSNTSNSALIDLSRVVQDAPFGFIAIQNNISPVIESFGRAVASAGGFKAAMAGIGSALLGPAGIGLAISAVTSGLTYYFQAQQRAKQVTKEAEEAIKSLADINNDLVNSIAKSTFGAQAEAAELNRLAAVAADVTQSHATRASALKALQEATNGYLDKLTLETIGTDKARTALDKYNTSLFQSALITAYKGKIDELGKSYADNESKADALKKQIEGLKDQLVKADGAIKNLGKTGLAFSLPNMAPGVAGTPGSIGASQIAAQKSFSDAQEGINTKTAEYNKILADQNALKNDSLGISQKIADLSTAVQPFTKTANADAKEGNKQIKEAYTGIQGLSKIFGSSQTVVDSFWYAVGGQNALKNSTNTVQGITDVLPKVDDQLSGYAAEAQAKIQGMIKPVVEKANEAKISMNSALSGAFSGLGETIGEALAGGGLQAAFKGVLNVFASFIKNIGESLIAAGTAMVAAKLLIKNPVTAIAAGIAAVAISTLLQAKINASVPKYAEGGMAIGPQLAIVGDNPSGREAIIPSEDFDKIGGGNIEGTIKASGQELLIIIKRAMAEENRIR